MIKINSSYSRRNFFAFNWQINKGTELTSFLAILMFCGTMLILAYYILFIFFLIMSISIFIGYLTFLLIKYRKLMKKIPLNIKREFIFENEYFTLLSIVGTNKSSSNYSYLKVKKFICQKNYIYIYLNRKSAFQIVKSKDNKIDFDNTVKFIKNMKRG